MKGGEGGEESEQSIGQGRIDRVSTSLSKSRRFNHGHSDGHSDVPCSDWAGQSQAAARIPIRPRVDIALPCNGRRRSSSAAKMEISVICLSSCSNAVSEAGPFMQHARWSGVTHPVAPVASAASAASASSSFESKPPPCFSSAFASPPLPPAPPQGHEVQLAWPMGNMRSVLR